MNIFKRKNSAKESSNKQKVIKNIYWASIGKIANIISGILVGIFVARYLGPEQFGLMNYVISYVTLFGIFSSFGLNNIEIRELSKERTNKNLILGTSFILRIIFSIITVLLILLSLLIFESDQKTFVLTIIFSSSLIFSPFNIIKNYFTSIVQNELIIKAEIIRMIIGAIIKIYLLFHCFELIWFIIASVIEIVFLSSGYYYSYKKRVGSIKKWQFNKFVAKELIFNSFPMLLSGAAIIIYQKVDQVIIGNFLNKNAVGQYAVASKIVELIIFVPAIIAQSVTPILVRNKETNFKRYLILRQYFMDILFWGTIFFALFISVSAGLLIRLLYGNAYIDSILILRILAWKAVFVALFIGSGQIIIIENLQKFAVLRNFIAMIVSVVMNLILIPIIGAKAAAITSIVTFFIAGYFIHLIISPYKFLIPIQTNSIFFGWRSLLRINLKIFNKWEKK